MVLYKIMPLGTLKEFTLFLESKKLRIFVQNDHQIRPNVANPDPDPSDFQSI